MHLLSLHLLTIYLPRLNYIFSVCLKSEHIVRQTIATKLNCLQGVDEKKVSSCRNAFLANESSFIFLRADLIAF